jgi:hypothetical protein
MVVLFALYLTVVADVPIEYGAMLYTASADHGVAPLDMAALLVSEHGGAYPADSVSDRGATGLYQIAPFWVQWANAEHSKGWTRDDLFDPAVSTELAAMIVRYTQDRVRSKQCDPNEPYHWVAHWKCSRATRETGCEYPVRKYKRIRAELDIMARLQSGSTRWIVWIRVRGDWYVAFNGMQFDTAWLAKEKINRRYPKLRNEDIRPQSFTPVDGMRCVCGGSARCEVCGGTGWV